MSAPLHGSGAGGPPARQGKQLPHRTNIRFVSGYAVQPKNEKISFAKVGDIVQRTGMLVIGAGIVGAMFKGADAMQKGADAMQKGVVVWERSVDSVDNWGCVFGLIFCLLMLLYLASPLSQLTAGNRRLCRVKGLFLSGGGTAYRQKNLPAL